MRSDDGTVMVRQWSSTSAILDLECENRNRDEQGHSIRRYDWNVPNNQAVNEPQQDSRTNDDIHCQGNVMR